MLRREFFRYTAAPIVMSGAMSGSSFAALPDSRSLVDTADKRAAYLQRLLKLTCTDTGPHPIGSPALEKAADIVKGEMARSLPDVSLDTFAYERWLLGSAPELLVGGRPVEAYPSHGTSGTPPEGIQGTLVRHGENKLTYGLVDHTSGKIAAYISTEGYEDAVPLPFYSFKLYTKCPPVFHVGTKNGSVIDRAFENKSEISMKADVRFIPNALTSNVVGTIPGKSNEEIVFIAHLDSVYNTEGANDNTASVIIMVMLAHAFSGIQPEKTLTFLATTGEEYDKLGAINYAEKRKREGTFKNIAWLVNFDSLTWGLNLQISSHDMGFREMIGAIDRDMDIPGTPNITDGDGFALDGRPFRDPSIRAMYVNSRGYDNVKFWHRPDDTADTVPLDAAETGFLTFRELIKRIMLV